MSQHADQPANDDVSVSPQAGPPPHHHPPARRKAWLTILILGLCVYQFLSVNSALREANGNQGETDALRQHGFARTEDVLAGDYYGLIASTFLHVEAWHMLFNGLGVWALAQRVEFSLGRIFLSMFWLTSAVVSSIAQLLFSESMGVGASGVAFALIGLMWRSRERYPLFAEIMTPGFVRYALIWLVGCVVVTQLGWLPIGNAAHVSGLIFGVLVGEALAGRLPRLWPAAAAALLLAVSIASLFWAPWSVHWLSGSAYVAHTQHRDELALDYYSRLIELDPDNSWAYYNRAMLHEERGEWDKAASDQQKSAELRAQVRQ